MTGRLITEILNIRSLQELEAQLEAEIKYYQSQKEDISERLGNFLREAEKEHSDEEWFKKMDIEKLGKRSKKSKSKGSDWIQFQGIELSSSSKGEAEVMFEAISKITERLEELEAAKKTVEELQKVGFGSDINYVCYLEDGVLTRLAIRPLNQKAKEKFSYNREFTIMKTIQD
ncbi:MAG: hypothetical protein PVH79_00800 [Candidatus Bathyarchaeota archaeon]